MKEKMKIKTEQGLGEPMEQTDLQRNNKILIWLAVILTIWTIIFIWLIWYVIKHNVIGHILSQGIC